LNYGAYALLMKEIVIASQTMPFAVKGILGPLQILPTRFVDGIQMDPGLEANPGLTAASLSAGSRFDLEITSKGFF
jgi:hypothetical protein